MNRHTLTPARLHMTLRSDGIVEPGALLSPQLSLTLLYQPVSLRGVAWQTETELDVV